MYWQSQQVRAIRSLFAVSSFFFSLHGLRSEEYLSPIVKINEAHDRAAIDCGPDNFVRGYKPFGQAPNREEYAAALNKVRMHQYADAMDDLLRISNEGDDQALALPETLPFREIVIAKHLDNLASDRFEIGYLYEAGFLGRVDYDQAFYWYNLADITDFCQIYGPYTGAKLRLGRLFFYGLGTRKNLSRARELWNYMNQQDFVFLLDHGGLPPTINDWEHYDFKEAMARAADAPTQMAPEAGPDAAIPQADADRFARFISKSQIMVFRFAHPRANIEQSTVSLVTDVSNHKEYDQVVHWSYSGLEYVTTLKYEVSYAADGIVQSVNVAVNENPNPQLAAFSIVEASKQIFIAAIANKLKASGRNKKAFVLTVAEKFVSAVEIVGIALKFLSND